jgi:hypothetical protein
MRVSRTSKCSSALLSKTVNQILLRGRADAKNIMVLEMVKDDMICAYESPNQ